MRFKRALTAGELAGAVRAELRDAAEEEIARELERRQSAWRERGLLIEQWDLDAIGADLDRCGVAGSPTKVYRVQAIVLTKQGHTEIAPTEAGVRQLIQELVIDRTLG